MELAEAIERAAARNVPLPSPAVRRAIRAASGLNQAELAAVLGVTRPSLTRYECGTREPRGTLRRAYADALRSLEGGRGGVRG